MRSSEHSYKGVCCITRIPYLAKKKKKKKKKEENTISRELEKMEKYLMCLKCK